ncbi:(2Fe-2S)-binding protein [Paenibacillus humicus]|uniref:(2Fe-2S)-binding protein n=1 Tax=Paenibacillus humicus TaxID=412861 RepID=UPI000FD95933|nr:(2Fe-2S)-binding protein [Paenibacillus humicus]
MSQETYDFGIIKTYYHISREGAEHPIFELEAERLFDSLGMGEALDRGGSLVQALDRTLPASFVGTSLGKLLLTQAYFYAVYGGVADLEAGNLVFQVEAHDDHVHLGYRVKEVKVLPVPTQGAEEWLAAYWRDYVIRFTAPAVRAAAEAAGIKPAAIWQQFGGQLEYMREFVSAMPLPEEVLRRFETGFEVLSRRLEPECFGTRRNPFLYAPRYVDNPWEPGGKLMQQSSCCMYDRREGGVKCYTCPMLTPPEREEQRKLAAAQAGG